MISASREFLTLIATVLIVGFMAAAMVRYSPGFDVDENAWNPAFSAATLEARHAKLDRESSLVRFYGRYLSHAIRGDFGQSESLQRPVTELLKARASVSLGLLLRGTLGGLAFGGLLAWLAVWPRRIAVELPAVATSGLLLAIPPAVLGLFIFFREWALWLGVALALAPRVFGTTRALLEDLYVSPALLAARARGVGPVRLAVGYVLGPAAPQLATLAGVAVVLAFGSLIPIEALCDIPGIGQLTWLAATKRDLPLLSAMALIIATMVGSVQWLGDRTR